MSDSPASAAPAATTAATLATILELVRGPLAWTIGPANRVTLGAGAAPQEPELNIHAVQPALLLEIASLASTTPHEDEDGILRWVAATSNGVAVTWFRR